MNHQEDPEAGVTIDTEEDKSKIALCLSGGGYRASLFHLGALRRLNELGILGRVDTLTSVSGGSILSAHLAGCLKKQPFRDGRLPDWENLVAAPFRKFCSRDIRTIPILKRPDAPLPALPDRHESGRSSGTSQLRLLHHRHRLRDQLGLRAHAGRRLRYPPHQNPIELECCPSGRGIIMFPAHLRSDADSHAFCQRIKT